MTTKISVMRNLSRTWAQSSDIESRLIRPDDRLFSRDVADECTKIDSKNRKNDCRTLSSQLVSKGT
jgi:hypothetical protein